MFKLTEQELLEIVKHAVEIIAENRHEFRGELICRLPYFVSILFTDHCIEREFERRITEKDIIGDAEHIVKDVINDFENGELKGNEYIKAINRETCIVTVFSMEIGRGKTKSGKAIKHLLAITSYIWDGRMNIDQGHNYYIGEESDEYLAAKEWNTENQDKVLAYMDWKRNSDVKRQMRKADKEYHYRSLSSSGGGEINPETRMKFINRTYDSQRNLDKKAIHDAMDPEDLKAIRDYYKEVDRTPLASKFSANRGLRAMDLRNRRKEENN